MARANNRRTKQPNGAGGGEIPSSSSSTAANATPPVAVDNDKHQPDQHYFEKRVHELETENKAYKKEIEDLRNKLANVPVSPSDSMRKMKEGYIQKLNMLEEQVKEFKKKQDVQSQLSIHRRKNNDDKLLQDEIQKLKAQKVQLQCKQKLDSVQFRLCKASLEKEILQLKKSERRNKCEMHKLLSLNQRQKMVLQRRSDAASLASDRLKQLLESQKALLCRKSGSGKVAIAGVQGIERELEVTSHINEICAEYENQIESMTVEIAQIKEEAETLKEENYRLLLQIKELECKEDADLSSLKDDLATLSKMVSQLGVQKVKFTQMVATQGDLSQPSTSTGSTIFYSDTNSPEPETSKEMIASKQKNASGICCSCSKKSLCKTMKCECRAAGGSCGTLCGCSHTKCSNREGPAVKLDQPTLEVTKENHNCSDTSEIEQISIPGPEDTMPIQNPPNLKPPEAMDHCGLKKLPLYDIANTLVKSFASKQNPSKRGRNLARGVSKRHNKGAEQHEMVSEGQG